MQKRRFVFSITAIIAVLVLTGAGCGQSKAPAGSAEAEFGKISDAISSGQEVICRVTIAEDDESESMETTYWIKGDDMRGEVDFGGMTSVFIQNGDKLYTSGSMMGSDECDWFVSTEEYYEEGDGEVSEDMEEFDYTQYEDNAMYKVDCDREKFNNSLLKPDGKVCDMDQMFEDMFEGMDLEGFDFEM